MQTLGTMISMGVIAPSIHICVPLLCTWKTQWAYGSRVMCIKDVFLHWHLKEVLYIEQIFGFVEYDHEEEMVYMLKVELLWPKVGASTMV